MVTVFVLELEHNKYYVGKSYEEDFCLDKHFNGNEIRWTQLHKPLKIDELIKNCDSFDEDKYVLEYMEKYGVKNVRGGTYNQAKLTKKNKITINRILDIDQDCNSDDDEGYDIIKEDYIVKDDDEMCYRCGRKGHLVEKCYAKTHFKRKNLDGCYKCGRDDHCKENCKHNTDIYGRNLGNNLMNIAKKMLGWIY
jgi:hypothetical protein